jgi:tetratricopeptide (TPR) repeat protein
VNKALRRRHRCKTDRPTPVWRKNLSHRFTGVCSENNRGFQDHRLNRLSQILLDSHEGNAGGKEKGIYLRLDRQRDATRNLNGIVHGEPNHANFALFVEAFLMMTHICLKDQQIDEAERYAEKALALNKSSGKAWEMKGMLAEKKKEYIAAANAYKRAWDISGHADLGVGFRLAVNYMRGQDPVEAIKVSRTILEGHPNYPKLKETVFLPCCAALRP